MATPLAGRGLTMRIHVLGSGSRGNAIVLESGGERLLVDAGFSPRALGRRLQAADVAPESIGALVVTHEHSDHIGGAAAAARRWGWPVHATQGTLRALDGEAGLATFTLPREHAAGEFTVRAVRTPHDATEPVALVVTMRSSGARVGIAYDLGHVTSRFAAHFAELDVLLIESNHDADMLRTGPYPWVVKQRIAGPNGHLSNADAGALLRTCAHRGLRHVVLCHLSQHNNRPELAIGAAQDALRGTAFRGRVDAASQGTPMSVAPGRTARPAQLSLSL